MPSRPWGALLAIAGTLLAIGAPAQSGSPPLLTVERAGSAAGDANATVTVGTVLHWSVDTPRSRSGPLVTGRDTVAADGTLDLGPYGTVPVAGLTQEQARATVERHLSNFMAEPTVTLRGPGATAFASGLTAVPLSRETASGLTPVSLSPSPPADEPSLEPEKKPAPVSPPSSAPAAQAAQTGRDKEKKRSLFSLSSRSTATESSRDKDKKLVPVAPSPSAPVNSPVAETGTGETTTSAIVEPPGQSTSVVTSAPGQSAPIVSSSSGQHGRTGWIWDRWGGFSVSHPFRRDSAP